jgi:outer membrane protein assembly factor BamB
MKMRKTALLLVTLCLTVSVTAQLSVNADRQWSTYRGPDASGYLDNTNLPDSWSVEYYKNIKWKIPVPGLALSSPVVWGDNLIITTAIGEGDTLGFVTGIYGSSDPVANPEHVYKVLMYSLSTGKLKWERTAYTGVPEVGRHPKSSHANCTPVTDGRHIVAFFGSEGLYCYDFEGDLLWKKDFGKLDAGAFDAKSVDWEFASSPIIHKDVIIIQSDVRSGSFVTALDITDGTEIWRKKRNEYPTWCTPNIYEHQGKEYVVLNGYKHRGAYEFETGKEVWKMSGGGDVPVPTPVIGDNLIYFNSAHGRFSPIMAVKKSARGDITLKDEETSNEYVKWSIPRGGSYMHSLLLYDGLLYNMRWNGQLSCLDPLTGEQVYREKLGKAESFISSPVASDGLLYIPNDMGMVYIIKAGKSFEILDEVPLGDICMTVPAITDDMIVFRTMKYLIGVGN